jgi:hypothetical protein
MPKYEILILSPAHGLLVSEEAHLSDHAAVRAGMRKAQGSPVEIWRGLQCVYGASSSLRTPEALLSRCA